MVISEEGTECAVVTLKQEPTSLILNNNGRGQNTQTISTHDSLLDLDFEGDNNPSGLGGPIFMQPATSIKVSPNHKGGIMNSQQTLSGFSTQRRTKNIILKNLGN